jgi:hypothetical protein
VRLNPVQTCWIVGSIYFAHASACLMPPACPVVLTLAATKANPVQQLPACPVESHVECFRALGASNMKLHRTSRWYQSIGTRARFSRPPSRTTGQAGGMAP